MSVKDKVESRSREFLERLVPLLEGLESVVYNVPDWRYLDGNSMWAMHCLDKAVDSIQAEISRLEK